METETRVVLWCKLVGSRALVLINVINITRGAYSHTHTYVSSTQGYFVGFH